MKIAYVLRYFPALTETFVLQELLELRRAGHDVLVVSMGERADSALAAQPSCMPVLRMPRGLRRGVLARTWIQGVASGGGLRPDVRRLRTLWVAEQLRDWGVDRLHAHFAGEAALWCRELSRALRVPYTVTVHAVDLFKPIVGVGDLMRDAQRVVTVCEHHAKHLSALYEVNATVVRMGVAEVASSPVAHRPRTPLRVVAVGRDVPKKGLDLLVNVVRSFEGRVHLRLVGNVSSARRGPWVTIGAEPHSKVGDVLRSADVFALPCRIAEDGDRDGIPVALMEAMAVGLPVITTTVAGIPELVDHTVGWLVPPDHEDGLEAALKHAMDARERRTRGEAGWARIVGDEWTVERQAREMLEVWRALNA